MDGITGSVLLLCLIGLATANSPPVIHTFAYQLCEDIPVGHHAFTINATDAENDPLTYSLFGTDAGYFAVDEHTGNVTIKRSLSREHEYLTLEVEVSDNKLHAQDELTIILRRANQNRPIFESPSYDSTIAEDTPLNQTVLTVKADDIDFESAGHEYYTITEVVPKEGSSLFSIGYRSGKVKLEGRLNYASLGSFYRLKIRATDGGGKCYYNETKFLWSEVYSFITVLDVPDLDPQFINGPYVIRVEENTPLGEPVFKVTAIDQDIGINDEITYSIQNSTASGLFNISSKDGVIFVKSPIDRESVGDTLHLTVKATESKPNVNGSEASATTNITINIIDVNDNKPRFYKCDAAGERCELAEHFTGEVPEHWQGSVVINMTVKDADLNYRTKLILEGVDKDVFSVQPQYVSSDSTVQLLVKQPQLLDYEKKHVMVVQVIAIDEDQPTFLSTATVTINILDINDNIPKFPRDVYWLNVTEHSPDGTVVAVITAEDNDTMDQGKITYSLLSDNIRLYVDVEPTTGSIYVKNSSLLDRETKPVLSVTLEARDTRDTDIQGTTLLEITVIDINDQPPVFKRESYLVFVEEGANFGVRIEATDADDPDTANSQIEYGIESSEYSANFTINPESGVLTNRGELDREAIDPSLNGEIKLNVTATDKGTPPLSSAVPVIINVEDVNDNTPQFLVSSYNFSVKEGEKGAFVGSVYAEDLDQTRDFNRISFSIIGGFGSFVIRTSVDGQGYRGNITVDPDIELDYESARNQFKMKVEATDLDQKKAEATVDVYVLDVNDERPSFRPMAPVTVKENTSISDAVGTFLGQDSDGNHSLVYELESIKCRCNGSLVACAWFTLDPTGEVRLNPEQTADYEECDQVLVEAQVVDVLTEKGENTSVETGEMVIIIEDINDNAPEFIPSDAVFVVVSESASKGTSVAGVTATDRDSEANGEITFKVTGVWFEDSNNINTTMRMLFEAITTRQEDIYVGIIQTTEGLDMSLKGKYLVTVSATDNGGLSSSTMLKIFTVDESYKVDLKFSKSVEEVERDRDKIIRSLTAATKAAVEVVAIRSDTGETSRASTITVMVVYFVYANGTALTSDTVEKMVSSAEHYPGLASLGLTYIGKPPEVIPDVDHVKFVLLGMVGGLLIVLAVLTTSLMCTRRNFKRKLKAAKAMNSASMVTSDNDKGGAVVPGTNKYTMEGANPVLNLTMVLDLDEHSSDVDKVSLNSLDLPDDVSPGGGEIKMNMLMIEEEEEEDDGPPEYIEPLDAALAQRGQKKDKLSVGFVNAAFSVTDL